VPKSAKIKGQFKITGNVLIEVHRDGKLLQATRHKNLVVATGRDLVRNLLSGKPNYWPNYIALGTNSTAVLDGDTALNTEAYRDVITARREYTSKIQFQLFIGQAFGNGNTYTEAGIFNDRSAVDTMLARVVFAGIAKTAADTITLSWDITISSS